jgi:hypothetical protein
LKQKTQNFSYECYIDDLIATVAILKGNLSDNLSLPTFLCFRMLVLFEMEIRWQRLGVNARSFPLFANP